MATALVVAIWTTRFMSGSKRVRRATTARWRLELREILVLASKHVDVATARAAAEAMRQRLEGRPHSDSGEMLSEERLR